MTAELYDQCARCGSSLAWEDCQSCGGEGCYEDDDDGIIEYRTCWDCEGQARFAFCLSSAEWCEQNPLPGREHVKSGTVEWFEVSR